MGLGGHGTINNYTDGSRRIVIKPTPVVYTAKELVLGLWDYNKSIEYDIETGEETYFLEKDCTIMGWAAFVKENDTKTKLVSWLKYYLYEEGIRNPETTPDWNTDERIAEIPSDAKQSIVHYLLQRVPSLIMHAIAEGI